MKILRFQGYSKAIWRVQIRQGQSKIRTKFYSFYLLYFNSTPGLEYPWYDEASVCTAIPLRHLFACTCLFMYVKLLLGLLPFLLLWGHSPFSTSCSRPSTSGNTLQVASNFSRTGSQVTHRCRPKPSLPF